jgi:hypothetical protein
VNQRPVVLVLLFVPCYTRPLMPLPFGYKEHRSERPAVWDYANPTAEKRVSLRKRLAIKLPRKPGKKKTR